MSISLLSQLYKVFSMILANRIEHNLDFHQATEQVGFRKGYSTIKHLQTVIIQVERATDYNTTIWVTFIDYRKAMYTVKMWVILKALPSVRNDTYDTVTICRLNYLR